MKMRPYNMIGYNPSQSEFCVNIGKVEHFLFTRKAYTHEDMEDQR